MARVVTATYHQAEGAQAALAALAEAGVPASAVRVERTHFTLSEGESLLSATGAPTWALRGVVGGAGLGGVGALLLHLGVLPFDATALFGTWWPTVLARGILAGAGFGLMVGFVLGLGQWEAEEPSTRAAPTQEVTLLSVSDPEFMAAARDVFWKIGADQISG